MNPMLPMVVGILAATLGLTVVTLRFSAAKKAALAQKRDTIASIASRLGLESERVGDLLRARGDLGRLKVEVLPDPERAIFELRVGLLTLGRLCLRPKGSDVRGPKTGQPTPSGDASFDAQVEVLGAGAALQAALADHDLKALAGQVVMDLGGVAVHNAIVVELPMDTSSEKLYAALVAMLKLSRWVNEPSAPREYHLDAPMVPPFHGFDDEHERDKAFVEHVGKMGEGKIVEGDSGWEWRGTREGLRVKVAVVGDEVTVEARVESPIENLELYWLPAQIPEPSDDEWDNEDPDVFVGYGVVLSQGFSMGENGEEVFAQRCLEWARIPESVRGELVGCMAKYDVHELVIHGSGWKAQMRRQVPEMFHPDLQLRGVVDTAARVAPELAKLQPVAGGKDGPTVQVHIAQVNRDTCGYCHSVFVWTTDARCPNCGGAVEARS